MNNDPEVIIIGSGPAGVSVAWPLVEAGLRVLMLDAAAADDVPPETPIGDIGQLRRESNRWKVQFGNDLAGLFLSGDYSPKLATPLARHVVARFATHSKMTSDNFLLAGSLIKGGLSTIWGANTAVYDDDDLTEFPITRADLLPSYNAIIRRIGVSGTANPDLGIEDGARMTAPAEHILVRSKKTIYRDFRLTRANNAVLMTQRDDGRKPCANCGLCLWGCHRQSIYSSVYDVQALLRHENFSYQPNRHVLNITASESGPVIDIAGQASHTARYVVLAAGTLMTTSLILRHLKLSTVALQSNPVGAIAFVVPQFFGYPLPEQSFSLAQLNYQLYHHGIKGAGALYGGDTLPLTEVANRLPLLISRAVALKISRALAPALLFATCYLPGAFSRNSFSVVGADGQMHISGGLADDSNLKLQGMLKQLSVYLRGLGAYALPGSLTLSPPGADLHYAATLPMGGSHIAVDGSVISSPGLYAVDGTILPTLPARHCTLTIMANADRIGRGLVATIKRNA